MLQFFEKISPANQMHRLKSALFVIHGANDPRVPLSEAERIVSRARATGRPVWSLYADNEGHGFRRRENTDYQEAATVMFLQRFLLGTE
jgi:dipeptidyl aminopeptidase/acylaminoacyl peptidase